MKKGWTRFPRYTVCLMSMLAEARRHARNGVRRAFSVRFCVPAAALPQRYMLIRLLPCARTVSGAARLILSSFDQTAGIVEQRAEEEAGSLALPSGIIITEPRSYQPAVK
jgi:hypothetical protein